MQIKLNIKRISKESIDDLLIVLHESFGTVAKDFDLTRNNNPTNGAFITKDKLIQKIEKGLVMFGYYQNDALIGTVGIEQSKDPNVYYIEKLCVLPKYRHNGIGFDLLSYSENEVRNLNGKIVSIGIINRNKQLKDWYIKNGYEEHEILSYDYLPFEVCVLKKEL